jgi:hypothetical protein
MDTNVQIKEISIEAVVTRRDGSVEDHGVLSRWTSSDGEPAPVTQAFLDHIRNLKLWPSS